MINHINPANDFFIRYLWGSEKNKDLTLSFINAVLEDSQFNKITSLEIRNPFNLKNFNNDKESVLDIKAIDAEGRIYNIEVQASGTFTFKYRSLFYWARLYSEQLIQGSQYAELQPTICINILDFMLFKDLPAIHSCFMLGELNNPDYILTDHLQLHFIELPKLNNLNQALDNKLIHWIHFLRNNKEDDLMKILIRSDKDIKKACEEYNTFAMDERLRDMYEARFKRLCDEASALSDAKREGIEQGIEQGIIGMYNAGVSLRLIADSFHWDEQRVQSVLQKHKLI